MISKHTTLAGVILAGGLARRMDNADKGLVILNSKPLVSYVISALNNVVDELYISANRNIDTYKNFGYPVIKDQTQDFSGPLAGILSAMNRTQADVLLVAPCDSPLIKAEHLQKMLDTLTNKNLENGERKVENWLKQHHWATTDLSDNAEIFTNINTYEELALLEEKLKHIVE